MVSKEAQIYMNKKKYKISTEKSSKPALYKAC